MILRQTFESPINGFWDGGAKKVFDWEIDGQPKQDSKGFFVRVGSWGANHWFHVALGKTDKQTLSHAKSKLQTSAQKAGKNCTFEYIEEV